MKLEREDIGYVFFMASSGHCSLDCSYCIVNPIVKHQPSLNYNDIDFLLNIVEEKTDKVTAMMFSGKGDFFAGYKKKENFLSNVLDRNVAIGLDINGVMIHEFPDLSSAQLNKIHQVNITMHYRQLLDHNARAIWKNNACIFIEKQNHFHSFLIGFILSPTENQLWDEALGFYEKEIFKPTGQKIRLTKDINLPFDIIADEKLAFLESKYSHMIEEVFEEDLTEPFKDSNEILCPAGQTFFRVWNNGDVHGCIARKDLFDCGNIKEKTFNPKLTMTKCSDTRHCDCFLIQSLDKIVFTEL